MLYRKARKNTYSMFEYVANNLRFLSDLYVYYRNAFLRLFLITLFLISNRIFLLECQDKETYIPCFSVYARETFYNNRDVIVAKSPGQCDVNMRAREKRSAAIWDRQSRVFVGPREVIGPHTKRICEENSREA